MLVKHLAGGGLRYFACQDIQPGPRFNNPLLSPDGRHLLFQRVEKGTSDMSALSGDGRWLVMVTIRGGRVTPGVARLYTDGATPRLGALVPIEGVVGIRRDGREVYARSANRELLAIALLPSERQQRLERERRS